ncbi:hypothetical protein Q3A66_09025 [Hymenobacter sp. BT770]|uniref:hypothetical protein n=1 Tax=Hymenobacter sp. BT770 TaxID=2886942 RepID=UPI001D113D26|nr:hypothetical protein [Hymenobacter sp. BT770]MCC3152108.1 hypothetical protein [Hymenobacter sp. BT770]MDO3415209.1 hypothetical protein [Hymenobacter sp. BT770]
MERQITLTLTNRWKATLLALGMVVVIFISMIGVALLVNRNLVLGAGGGVLFLIGLFILPEWLANRFSRESAVVIVDDAGLTVRPGVVGCEQRFNFVDLASYSIDSSSGVTLRPRAGRPLHLHFNYKLHPKGFGPMGQLQHHLELAVAQFQREHPNQPPIRNLGLLDQRRAIALLLGAAFLLAWRCWWLVRQPFVSEGQWGGLIVGGLLFTLYALVWWNRRRELQRL